MFDFDPGRILNGFKFDPETFLNFITVSPGKTGAFLKILISHSGRPHACLLDWGRKKKFGEENFLGRS